MSSHATAASGSRITPHGDFATANPLNSVFGAARYSRKKPSRCEVDHPKSSKREYLEMRGAVVPACGGATAAHDGGEIRPIPRTEPKPSRPAEASSAILEERWCLAWQASYQSCSTRKRRQRVGRIGRKRSKVVIARWWTAMRPTRDSRSYFPNESATAVVIKIIDPETKRRR